MSDLDKAIAISSRVHSGQVDKAGQPYILHPLRVMLKFQNEHQRIVAVLHDVIEDSEISLDDLKRLGFSTTIIEAIDCLTKRNGETYEEFISRVSLNDLARNIKIEDIKDNMDLTRIDSINDIDLARVKKYHRALKFLSKS
ncbi:MAG: GTP pyrophosphokinase [Methylobacter sp.]|uniref:GTP pyrophosphokinase n=1 Tax=Methylobacter sp. TaxID=2051955 RepID=UPI002583B6B9|nr:GTP pyrophosphokinase [Methylobacter sp.]MCL7422415.1 GTP pyrophosphokinase [Methylobacter sp.]